MTQNLLLVQRENYNYAVNAKNEFLTRLNYELIHGLDAKFKSFISVLFDILKRLPRASENRDAKKKGIVN